ncbi:DMT family transporter [soil metagenome]
MRLTFAGVRFMIAGMLLFPFCRRPAALLERRVWGGVVAVALGQTFFQYLFFYNGLSVSSGVLGALVMASSSFWWVLLAPVALGTSPPTRLQWATLVACAGGIALAVWRPGAGAGQPVLGGVLFLGSSLAGAVALLAVRKLGGQVGAASLTAFSLFSGGVLLALCGIPGWGAFAGLVDVRVAVATLYLAAVSATAFGLWNRLAGEFSPNELAGYRFLIPLCGTVLSASLVPGETIGAGAAVGGLLVVGALAVQGVLTKRNLVPPAAGGRPA